MFARLLARKSPTNKIQKNVQDTLTWHYRPVRFHVNPPPSPTLSPPTVIGRPKTFRRRPKLCPFDQIRKLVTRFRFGKHRTKKVPPVPSILPTGFGRKSIRRRDFYGPRCTRTDEPKSSEYKKFTSVVGKIGIIRPDFTVVEFQKNTKPISIPTRRFKIFSTSKYPSEAMNYRLKSLAFKFG